MYVIIAHRYVLLCPVSFLSFFFLQDIINYRWLVDCVSATPPRLLPLSRNYVIYATPATEAALAREVDQYGDSYTMDTDMDMIKKAMDDAAKCNEHPFRGGGECKLQKTAAFSKKSLEDKLNEAMEAPPAYQSCIFSFPTPARSLLTTPTRAFIGFDVFVFGGDEPVEMSVTHLHTRAHSHLLYCVQFRVTHLTVRLYVCVYVCLDRRVLVSLV